MLIEVQRNSRKWALCAVAAVLLGGGFVRANVDPNPYGTIVDRNPFALKPPPPPPPQPEATAPPVPMAKVTLTGIVSSFGEPRALFEIIEDGAKGGGTPKRPILREGERMGPVEVLGIDIVKNTVRLRNSGVETNVTFPEVAKSGPVPGGPGVPAGSPPTFTPPPINVPQPAHNPQASAPTVISPNGAAPSSGVTLMGNNAAVTPTATAGLPGALGTSTDGGMRTIPSRPLRTENTGTLPPMTKEQADLLMEVNRLRVPAGSPLVPPTSLTPVVQGAEQEAQQNPAYPRLPYNPRSGPPPLPGR